MAKKKQTAYQRQAEALSLVRYGPEVSALTALLRDAQSTRDTRLRQAVNARDAGVSSALGAIPAVRQAYRGANAQVTPAFVNGGGIEAQALRARTGESQALAVSQLQDRRVAAVQGAGAARGQILREFSQDKGKITQRALDLKREYGAFTASTIQDLLGADAKAAADANELGARLTQQERNSIRASGQNPDKPLPGGGYAPIPGGRLDPKAHPGKPGKGNQGRGWATGTQQAAASDTLQQALHEASTLKQTGAARHEVAQLLLEGADEVKQPVYRTVKKNGRTTQQRVLNPDGTQKMRVVPGLPQIKSQLLLSAALDIAYDGHLSRRNQKLLHDRGIKIGPLGVRTYGDFLKSLKKMSRAPRVRNAPSGIPGQSRPT